MNVQLNIPSAAAARHHIGVKAIGEIQNFAFVVEQCLAGLFDIAEVDDLYLAYQYRVCRFGLEAAAAADELIRL
jgi:hypothetical protein